eukprot:TRINITY_DN29001_c0_g1_i1.p1 TRINITY_DN29001_c0_g1~~TRINITY_DN29001_c0_g1_i1.p1  ORF type:complete len:855 (-),score=189.57 TRINITY_DN29001_c0_g1_i1:359-2839(-)
MEPRLCRALLLSLRTPARAETASAAPHAEADVSECGWSALPQEEVYQRVPWRRAAEEARHRREVISRLRSALTRGGRALWWAVVEAREVLTAVAADAAAADNDDDVTSAADMEGGDGSTALLRGLLHEAEALLPSGSAAPSVGVAPSDFFDSDDGSERSIAVAAADDGAVAAAAAAVAAEGALASVAGEGGAANYSAAIPLRALVADLKQNKGVRANDDEDNIEAASVGGISSSCFTAFGCPLSVNGGGSIIAGVDPETTEAVEVTLSRKSPTDLLGFTCEAVVVSGIDCLKVVSISAQGLLGRWNREASPSMRVNEGSLVLSVNGVSSELAHALESTDVRGDLVLRVAPATRGDFDDFGRRLRGLRRRKDVARPSISTSCVASDAGDAGGAVGSSASAGCADGAVTDVADHELASVGADDELSAVRSRASMSAFGDDSAEWSVPRCRCGLRCKCGIRDALGLASEVWSSRHPPCAALRIGGLRPDVDEEALYRLFTRLVPVATVRVVRNTRTWNSECHGFVNFWTFQDAETVLGALDGANFFGRRLQLSWSSRARRGRDELQSRVSQPDAGAAVVADASVEASDQRSVGDSAAGGHASPRETARSRVAQRDDWGWQSAWATLPTAAGGAWWSTGSQDERGGWWRPGGKAGWQNGGGRGRGGSYAACRGGGCGGGRGQNRAVNSRGVPTDTTGAAGACGFKSSEREAVCTSTQVEGGTMDTARIACPKPPAESDAASNAASPLTDARAHPEVQDVPQPFLVSDVADLGPGSRARVEDDARPLSSSEAAGIVPEGHVQNMPQTSLGLESACVSGDGRGRGRGRVKRL